MTNERSASAFERARALMPGGVSSPVRAFGAVGGTPRFAARGYGSRIEDVDGHVYLDLVSSWGPLILGHAHPRVIEAVERASRLGTSFGAPTEAESDLARAVIEAMPSIEMIRFTSSGTEAAMSALRLARAATGRDRIIKMDGCYHGHSDQLLVNAGSGSLHSAVASSPGVTSGASRDTISVPFNDLSAVRKALQDGSVAAVIVEPIAANMGVVPPADGYLQGLREATIESGSLLILDEVVTGFRVAYGGAQEMYGIEPDLTVLGKILGGGMPLAAYGGRADLMSLLAPVGDVYQAGTLAGNPVSVAAGIATLEVLRQERPYDRLEEMGTQLDELDLPAGRRLQRIGSMLTLFFREEPITDLASAQATDDEAFSRWFHRALDQGIWWPPSRFEAAFLSTAMSNEDLERIAEVLTS